MLASVEGLAARNITPSVFVVDFMSWAHMGDFTFNPKWWPTPKGEFFLFTVTFCANPANDLTCPPSYIII